MARHKDSLGELKAVNILLCNKLIKMQGKSLSMQCSSKCLCSSKSIKWGCSSSLLHFKFTSSKHKLLPRIHINSCSKQITTNQESITLNLCQIWLLHLKCNSSNSLCNSKMLQWFRVLRQDSRCKPQERDSLAVRVEECKTRCKSIRALSNIGFLPLTSPNPSMDFSQTTASTLWIPIQTKRSQPRCPNFSRDSLTPLGHQRMNRPYSIPTIQLITRPWERWTRMKSMTEWLPRHHSKRAMPSFKTKSNHFPLVRGLSTRKRMRMKRSKSTISTQKRKTMTMMAMIR